MSPRILQYLPFCSSISLFSIPIYLQTSVTFVSVANGPLGGLFILGGIYKKANWKVTTTIIIINICIIIIIIIIIIADQYDVSCLKSLTLLLLLLF